MIDRLDVVALTFIKLPIFLMEKAKEIFCSLTDCAKK